MQRCVSNAGPAEAETAPVVRLRPLSRADPYPSRHTPGEPAHEERSMAIARELAYAHVDDLYLDPTNPRLGRHNTGRDLTQAQVLDQMQGWDLEELAVSFVQNGF